MYSPANGNKRHPGENFFPRVPLKVIFILCILLLVILFALSFWGMQGSSQSLIIKNGKTGEVGWSGDIENGENFSIKYIHSVDKLPVYEFYTCENGKLILTGIKVIDFGAGLDYMGEGELRYEGKWTYIENMNREIGSLPLRVGSIADHTLIYRNKEINLREHFPAFTLVQLEVN